MSDFEVSEWPDSNRVEIISARNPVSLQGSAVRRASLKADLGAAVAAATTGVFTGDVEVTIEWFVSPEVRYGSHMIADIDNIVKPLLDAVTGPDGVMIDDNQVQSLRVSWQYPYSPAVKFRLTLEAEAPDQYVQRDKLFFVEFSPDLCFPLFLLEESDPGVRMIVQHLHGRLQTQRELADSGHPDGASWARGLAPIQRFFPKARLSRYPVRPSTGFL